MADIKPLYHRSLPRIDNWMIIAVTSIISVGAGLAITEFKAREADFKPNIPVTPGLWITQRNALRRLPEGRTVLAGASRICFGIDLDTWEETTGHRPIILAWPGGCIIPVLKDLAEDDTFQDGLLICSYTSPLVLQSEINRTGSRKLIWQIIDQSKDWGPFDSFNHELKVQIHSSFACLQSEVTAVTWFQKVLNISDRNNLEVQWEQLFPYFANTDEALQQRARLAIETDSHLRETILRAYRLAMDAFVPPSDVSEIEPLFKEIGDHIAKIRQRGCQVVWVRYPSSGEFLEYEKKHFPRHQYWERVLEASRSPGIHYEDYPELRIFEPVETSHLTARDAVLFTPLLINLIKQKLSDNAPLLTKNTH